MRPGGYATGVPRYTYRPTTSGAVTSRGERIPVTVTLRCDACGNRYTSAIDGALAPCTHCGKLARGAV